MQDGSVADQFRDLFGDVPAAPAQSLEIGVEPFQQSS
jgi:hypothetical protein